MRHMLRHWFLFAVGLAVLAAWRLPGPGAAVPWLSWVLVPTVFLCAGLGLPGAELRRAARDWRLHAAVQGTSFLLLPPLFAAAAWLLHQAGVPPAVTLGVVILGCLPTTITSCVIFTRQSGGDEAGAVVNAVLGNLLGIAVTPALIWLLAGHTGHIDPTGAVRALLLQVALPMAVGQVARRWLAAWAETRRSALSTLSNLCLVGVVWQAFSAGFAHGMDINGGMLALTAGAMALLHGLALLVPTGLGTRLTLDRARRVTLAVCASQKTIALGIPLIYLLLPRDPQVALVTVPLLLYHPVQLLAASIAAPRWLKWVEAAPRERRL
jgi:sodium/bile acid cotransporter 7